MRRRAFLFMSSNKVYGDAPNRLPLVARATRSALPEGHPFVPARYRREPVDRPTSAGIRCSGFRKAAADLMVQEYAARFGLTAQVFRAGCITGLSIARSRTTAFSPISAGRWWRASPIRVISHRGLQVRDNLYMSKTRRGFARAVAAPQSGGLQYRRRPGPPSR